MHTFVCIEYLISLGYRLKHFVMSQLVPLVLLTQLLKKLFDMILSSGESLDRKMYSMNHTKASFKNNTVQNP